MERQQYGTAGEVFCRSVKWSANTDGEIAQFARGIALIISMAELVGKGEKWRNGWPGGVGFYCFVYLFHGLFGFVQGDDFVSELFNYSAEK